MTAAALVATLRARGVTLAPRGDRLRVRPASAVTPDEVEALRRLKPEVLRLIAGVFPPATSGRTWYAYPWPDALPGLGSRHVGPFDECADCERWSWARYGGVVLCLACARRRLAEPGPPERP